MDVSGFPASLSAVFRQPLPSSLKPPKVTPLPQPEIPPTSSVDASGAATSSGPSISAFSVNVQLLQISIRQQSNGSAQVDVVKQHVKLFRAEVKSTVRNAVEGLDDDAKQAVDQLLKRFSRHLKPKPSDDGDDDRDGGSRRGRRTDNPQSPSSVLASVQSALGGLISGLQAALESDDLQPLVVKLQDLFKQLGDRLQPAAGADPTPRGEDTEVPSPADSRDGSDDRSNGTSSVISFSFTVLSVQTSYQRVQAL